MSSSGKCEGKGNFFSSLGLCDRSMNQMPDLLYIQQLARLPIKFHLSCSFELLQYENIRFLTKWKVFLIPRQALQLAFLVYFCAGKIKFRCDSTLNKIKIKKKKERKKNPKLRTLVFGAALKLFYVSSDPDMTIVLTLPRNKTHCRALLLVQGWVFFFFSNQNSLGGVNYPHVSSHSFKSVRK